MGKKLSPIGNYANLYYKTKIHNRALIEDGKIENPKKNIRLKRKTANEKAEEKLENLRARKLEFLKEFEDLIKPVVNIDKIKSANEDILRRKLLENRERYKDEIRLHGEQTSIKEGFVYVIENCSYPGWVKVGMAFDYEKRLSVYNQYDPERRYAIKGLRWTPDRRSMETRILTEMGKHADKRSGEWFNIDIQDSLNIFYSINE